MSEALTLSIQSPKFTGRKVLYAPYRPAELTIEIIFKILKDIFPDHIKNRTEIDYLYKYFKGDQPILNKVKRVRPDINNIVVENIANHIVEFKKGYVFGDPIQYIQIGEQANKEISTLNSFMSVEDKSSKDKDLAEWLYICAIAHRLILPDRKFDTDQSPFEIYNLDPRNTFVVYSSFFEHEVLFGATYVSYKDRDSKKTKRKFSIYTDKMYYEVETDDSTSFVPRKNISSLFAKPHILGEVPIIEYTLNQSRLSTLEVVLSGLDILNNLTSCEADDIQQFVQSLLVFTNQDIDLDTFADLISLGAIKIKYDNPQMPAKVEMLSDKLDYTQTKVLYDRIYDNILTICGLPRMNDKPSGGDTGQARLLGEGWTMADMRAKQDELAFKISEKKIINIALRICRDFKNSGIVGLTVKDIDIKFTRNKSDNLLVKTQGLLNLKSAGISPNVAIPTCGLFSDATEVVNAGKEFFGEGWWKEKNEPQQEASKLENKL